MFIDVNSIQIKKPGGSYISLGNYNGKCLIAEAKYGYHKLWGKDTGRNLAGVNSGTLIGIFPKITIQFNKLTRAQLEALIPILDNAEQIVKYYDPFLGRANEISTYTNDYEVTNKQMLKDDRHRNEGFSVAFISNKKR